MRIPQFGPACTVYHFSVRIHYDFKPAGVYEQHRIPGAVDIPVSPVHHHVHACEVPARIIRVAHRAVRPLVCYRCEQAARIRKGNACPDGIAQSSDPVVRIHCDVQTVAELIFKILDIPRTAKNIYSMAEES